ncbi:MAG: hypothetical protein JO353_10845 [Phycisphaerae bacterium]|nr:hypothetical protein [Phycisphaerae bacterium]
MLIGAGIGVGLMYLLDPELGAQRRSRLNKVGQEHFSKARGLAHDLAATGMGHLHEVAGHIPTSVAGLGSLMSPAIGAAKEAYSHIGSHFQDLQGSAQAAMDQMKSSGMSNASQARDQLHSVRDQLIARLNDKVNELSGPARVKYSKTLRDVTLAMGRDEDHHYVGQTACALGSLALGAGLVYLLDPDKGHDRRVNLTSALTTSVYEIGEFFRRVGSRMMVRGHRIAEQATEQFGDVAQKAAEIRDNYMGSAQQSEDASLREGINS